MEQRLLPGTNVLYARVPKWRKVVFIMRVCNSQLLRSFALCGNRAEERHLEHSNPLPATDAWNLCCCSSCTHVSTEIKVQRGRSVHYKLVDQSEEVDRGRCKMRT